MALHPRAISRNYVFKSGCPALGPSLGLALGPGWALHWALVGGEVRVVDGAPALNPTTMGRGARGGRGSTHDRPAKGGAARFHPHGADDMSARAEQNLKVKTDLKGLQKLG